MDLSNLLDTILGKLETWLYEIAGLLPNVLLAVVIVVGFGFLARYARKLIGKLGTRLIDSEIVVRLLGNVAFSGVVLTGVFFALGALNLEKTVTSLLAGAGIVGLALSFAFQDVATNLISGVFLAAKRPFRIGDLIETNGILGIVDEVQLRSTTMHTFTGQEVVVPNKSIFQNPLTNYTKLGRRRIDLSVGVSYGEDLEKVRRVALEAIRNLDAIDQEMEHHLYYAQFGGSSIDFVLMYWSNGVGQASYLQAISEGIIAVKKAFDREGITIPYPIRTLDFGIKGGQKLSEMLQTSES